MTFISSLWFTDRCWGFFCIAEGEEEEDEDGEEEDFDEEEDDEEDEEEVEGEEDDDEVSGEDEVTKIKAWRGLFERTFRTKCWDVSFLF